MWSQGASRELHYARYAADADLRTGYRLLFAVGVLALLGAGLIFVVAGSVPSDVGSLLRLVAGISLVFGVIAIVAGFGVRRRIRAAVLVGIGVGAVGVALSFFK